MLDRAPRQRQLLALLLERRGYPPTQRELADLMGLRSTRGVAQQIGRLAKKGYIVHSAGRSRGLAVTAKALELGRPSPEPIQIVPMVRCINCEAVRAIVVERCPLCPA